MTSDDLKNQCNTIGGPPGHAAHLEDGAHNHNHFNYDPDAGSIRLLATLVINFIIPAIQLVGGFFANSIALISDAVHNFSDFTAIFISYVSMRIGRKGASARHTFGFQRAEIIGALINVMILICAVVFIVYEAIIRLYHPETVSGKLVIIMAGAGIVGNGFSAVLLHRDSKHNLNIRGAFLHMLGDFLTSLMVLIIGVILMFKQWFWLDPLLSFLIVVFILANCWSVMKEAVSVLMNATPKGLDLEEVQKYLESVPEIASAHYLHAWNIGNCGIAFSCHLTVADQPISDTEILSEKIRHHLFHQFGIDHPVLQFETDKCGDGGMLCELSSSELGKLKDPSAADVSSNKNQSTTISKIISTIIRVILGVIFIAAGAPKILYPMAFAEALFNYQMLPDVAINMVAIALPWVEVIIGGMLIVGFWVPGAILMYNIMMVTFISALSYNVHRGLNIHCGCFSPGSGEAISMTTVFRDLLIFSMSLYILYTVYFKKWFVKSNGSG